MFYTDFGVKHYWIGVALLAVLISSPGLQATENQYLPGQIVSVEKKSHERVLYYLVNTPVTQDDPYYELALRQNNWIYVTQFSPRHAADTLPDDWKPGAEIQMKIEDKHHVSVREQGGRELSLAVVKRLPAADKAPGAPVRQ
jgi:hypothetical protein